MSKRKRLPPAKWVFAAVFGAVLLLGLGSTFFMTLLLPPVFVSETRIKMESGYSRGTNLTAKIDPDEIHPAFKETQLQMMRSDAVLDRVVDSLDLNTVWGKRYAGGERLKTTETRAILESRLALPSEPKSRVVSIQVESDSAPETAAIADAIAAAYADYRLKWHQDVLAKIQADYDVEDRRLQQSRDEMYQLRTNANLLKFDAQGHPAPPSEAEIRQGQSEFLDAELMLAELLARLTNFTSLPPDKQRDVVGLLNETNATRAAPEPAGRLTVREALEQLTNRLASVTAARAAARQRIELAKANWVAQCQATNRYAELQSHAQRADDDRGLAARRLAAKRAELPEAKSPVEIIEKARVPLQSTRRGVTDLFLKGAAISAVLALFVGGLAALVIGSFRKSP